MNFTLPIQILNVNIKFEEAHPSPWPYKSIGEKNSHLKRRLQSNSEHQNNTAHSRISVPELQIMEQNSLEGMENIFKSFKDIKHKLKEDIKEKLKIFLFYLKKNQIELLERNKK